MDYLDTYFKRKGELINPLIQTSTYRGINASYSIIIALLWENSLSNCIYVWYDKK